MGRTPAAAGIMALEKSTDALLNYDYYL